MSCGRDGKITPANLAAHRSRFLYIGQKPLPFDGTAGEYLNLPFTFAANRRLRADLTEQDRLMESLSLDPALKKAYSRLSGGEQQRLTIIQGLQLERDSACWTRSPPVWTRSPCAP